MHMNLGQGGRRGERKAAIRHAAIIPPSNILACTAFDETVTPQ